MNRLTNRVDSFKITIYNLFQRASCLKKKMGKHTGAYFQKPKVKGITFVQTLLQDFIGSIGMKHERNLSSCE